MRDAFDLRVVTPRRLLLEEPDQRQLLSDRLLILLHLRLILLHLRLILPDQRQLIIDRLVILLHLLSDRTRPIGHNVRDIVSRFDTVLATFRHTNFILRRSTNLAKRFAELVLIFCRTKKRFV